MSELENGVNLARSARHTHATTLQAAVLATACIDIAIRCKVAAKIALNIADAVKNFLIMRPERSIQKEERDSMYRCYFYC